MPDTPELNEILRQQGTRKSDIPPWMTYAASFDEKLSPELEEAVKQYSETKHVKSSAQNEEELCRQTELSDETAKQYQWVHPDEYKNEGERIGKIIHSSELINKFRKEFHVDCWYREHPNPRKITLIVKKYGFEPEVACWVQLGFMPEYTIMKFDEHGAPLDEKYRGWRTVLLQLILKDILKEEDVKKHFGEATGDASKKYNSLLYEWRNRKFVVA